MLWTSDVVKDPWFPLVKDPSEVCPSVLLPPKSIYGKYLQDHSSNPLATDYAEIAQNSFADALMLGAREASVLM